MSLRKSLRLQILALLGGSLLAMLLIALVCFQFLSATRLAHRTAWLEWINPSDRMRRWLARSVSPDEVMSALASAVRFLTVPSVAPWLSTS